MKYDLWQIDAVQDELGNWIWNDKCRIKEDIDFVDDADHSHFMKYVQRGGYLPDTNMCIELVDGDESWYEIQLLESDDDSIDRRPVLCFIPTD